MEKQIKIEYQSGYLLCERRNPINGEYWVYISPKEWETKEDIIPTKANHPIGWFDKLHDKENYYTIVGTFVNGYAFEQALSKAEDKGEVREKTLTEHWGIKPQPTNSLYVKEKLTDQVFKVWKYIESNDGEVSVWCNDWYGRHVIGQDCEFSLPPKP